MSINDNKNSNSLGINNTNNENSEIKYDVPDYSYGACLIGPPGSGKTTCIKVLAEMCEKLKRNIIVLNLDPANDNLPYKVDFDIASLCTVDKVMKNENLGPNGALLYCMETLSANVDEVVNSLKPVNKKASYYLIDFPGQVELYTHSDCIMNFLKDFQEKLNLRLATVNFVDCVLASTKQGYLGQSLMSLSTMLRLCTPHVNVLSKYDLVQNEEIELPFDESHCDFEATLFGRVPHKLHEAIVYLLRTFDLVSYHLYSSYDETSVIHLIELVDKAVGCTWML